jgi:tRNA modification GTPase
VISSDALCATYAAQLTPLGTGAIATLAIRGPRAWTVLRALFRFAKSGKQLPPDPEPGTIWLGRLGENAKGAAADEVVLSVKRPGPVPWVELHCHGGQEVIRFLIEILEKHGIQICPWQHLEQITGGDPFRAMALAALVEARTIRTAAILLDQYQGAFRRAVQAVQTSLQENQLGEVEARLGDLVRHTTLGRHLTTPWRVVVAGAPNVGKSSLVNALAGYQRSVVAPTPGTTRDVVTTLVAVEGWPVELTDTAGLRGEAASLEQLGIDRAQAVAGGADLCLWVLDGSVPPVWPSVDSQRLRLVINKVDLPTAWDFARAGAAVRVSAQTGVGLADLRQALARDLVPSPPAPGTAVPFSAALCDRVEEAWRHLSEGRPAAALHKLESASAVGDAPKAGP